MPSFLQAVAGLLCVLVIVGDFYQRRVRNPWLIAALLTGAAWLIWFWTQHAAAPLITAITGLVIGMAVLLPFYIGGLMGAGDVKFFATLGFLLGAKTLLPIWIIGSLLGGMHAVTILLSRYLIRYPHLGLAGLQMWATQSRLWQHVLVARNGRKGLPYAAYMAIGALLTMFFQH